MTPSTKIRRVEVVASHVHPPIPLRNCDWLAHYEGEEERCEYGWGATEADAIRDLVENYQPPGAGRG